MTFLSVNHLPVIKTIMYYWDPDLKSQCWELANLIYVSWANNAHSVSFSLQNSISKKFSMAMFLPSKQCRDNY